MYEEFNNKHKDSREYMMHSEDEKEKPEEKSFWEKLAKLFNSLAMFNAINKHY